MEEIGENGYARAERTVDWKKQWNTLARSKKNKAFHYIQYLAVLGLEQYPDSPELAADYVIRKASKAFKPVKNKKRLDNGQHPWWELISAIYYAWIKSCNPFNHTYIDEVWKRYDILGIQSNDKPKYGDAIGKVLHLIVGEYPSIIGSGLIKYCDKYWNIAARPFTRLFKYLDRHYCYIFVRQDISPEYQLVQAAHVAMEAGRVFGERTKDVYFCVIGVDDSRVLGGTKWLLDVANIKCQSFYEPDVTSETAICTEPIHHEKRGFLKNYKRLVFQKGPVCMNSVFKRQIHADGNTTI